MGIQLTAVQSITYTRGMSKLNKSADTFKTKFGTLSADQQACFRDSLPAPSDAEFPGVASAWRAANADYESLKLFIPGIEEQVKGDLAQMGAPDVAK